MNLEKINEITSILNDSPIRAHLKNVKDISIFENEKVILSDIDRIIQINKQNLKEPLKIVVLGEVKAGKSTLVNSLIGKRVSYTNVVEATSAILEIKYNNQEKISINTFSGKNIELKSLNELDNLIDQNKKNHEFFNNINKISIETNMNTLKEITLVDTPGLNTVTNENEERTENYIANADVILWILNSHHLGQSDVASKIDEVLDYGKPIICVVNRIDEINGNSYELVEYVKEEMGYMFTEVFATSAKKAWEGYCENNSSKLKESNINEVYKYILNNIERNAEKVQKDSIVESIKMQIQKDLYTHKGAELRIDAMLQSFQKDIKELKQFNGRIKDIINNKINEWIDTGFFEEEKKLLSSCSKDEEFTTLVKKYTSEDHIQTIVKFEYEKLQEYIADEWRNNTEEFIKRQCINDIDLGASINPYNIIGTENTQNDNEVIGGIKQGGITAGAIGVGLAGYAAWLGPAAAYVSIGSAVAAFLPPLLIAGALGGAVWKLLGTDKKKINRYNQIDSLVFEIKSAVKNSILKKMKENLYSISDYYFKSSSKMITSIVEQCNITSDELVRVKDEINRYINRISSMELGIIETNSIYKGILNRNEEYQLENQSINYSIKSINTKIVGVTVDNRQKYIKSCHKNQKLDLVREPQNEYDKNAIAVYCNENKVGYLKKELAFEIANKIDNGANLECRVVGVSGGGDYNYGLNVRINDTRQDSSYFHEEDGYDDYIAYDCDDYDEYDDYEINRKYASDPCDADPDMCCGYDH